MEPQENDENNAVQLEPLRHEDLLQKANGILKKRRRAREQFGFIREAGLYCPCEQCKQIAEMFPKTSIPFDVY